MSLDPEEDAPMEFEGKHKDCDYYIPCACGCEWGFCINPDVREWCKGDDTTVCCDGRRRE